MISIFNILLKNIKYNILKYIMSDTKIKDTLSETVANVFKKSGLSDKLERFGLYLVIPFVGVIICGIYGFQILSEQNTKNRNENMIINSVNRDLIINLNNKIDSLNEKISEKLDKQETTLTHISEMSLFNICKEKPISEYSLNISKLTEELHGKQVVYIELKDDELKDDELKDDELKDDELKDDELKDEEKNNDWIDTYDNEVINECYDSLPLNGVKKLTSVKSFFWYEN
jgi:hypothetical protein